MSKRDVQLSEIAGLLQPHISLPRTGCPDDEAIAEAEEEIGFALPEEYHLFSKTFGTITWPSSIVDAEECVDLLEDLNVPRSFAPIGELELVIAGFRPDSDFVWLWDGQKLQNTGETFLAWLKGLSLATKAREARARREAQEAAEPPASKAAVGAQKTPRPSRPRTDTPKSRSSRVPADAPKRLKKLVSLIRKARRFEAFAAEGGRWGVRVAEEGGVRTSFVTAQELGQLEAWSGIRAVRS